MKILYAIQGTGNGHITVAKDLIPRLKQYAEVDILISGCHVEITLPFEVKYRLNGLGFVFGKSGGIDYVETYKRSKLKELFKEVGSLPVEDYDLVISDFEPVAAWACYLKKLPCVGLSHQAAVAAKGTPKAKKTDLVGHAVLNYYAPSKHKIGFHYRAYDDNIYTPIIRKEVRELPVSNSGHYAVYLPAFSDKRIVKLLSCFPNVEWEVFSKHTKSSYSIGNIAITPINNEAFLQSMASAEGVLCGAGFQTPAEVMFLRKKVMVIPMKGQYEQQCNAVALKQMGIPVLKNLKLKRKEQIEEWLNTDQNIDVDFPDIADDIVQLLLNIPQLSIDKPRMIGESYGSFRRMVLEKIFYKPETK